MTAQRLIRLYPRAWRARYGDEMGELLGERALSSQQAIDLIFGAVDAWVSPGVRRAARGAVAANEGGYGMTNVLKAMKCSDARVRYTTRDMMVSALVLLACSVLLSVAGIAASRSGHEQLGDSLKALSFPLSVLVSMPFGVSKGQPWRAQVVIIGVTAAILVTAAWVATKI